MNIGLQKAYVADRKWGEEIMLRSGLKGISPNDPDRGKPGQKIG